MNIVADRLSRIKPSMTVGINTKANAKSPICVIILEKIQKKSQKKIP